MRSSTTSTGASLISLTTERAEREAAASASRLAEDATIGPIDGATIVWKDVFDVAGTRTTAGSATRAEAPPARHDGPLVARAQAAGAVTLGKASMSELAFSGLGINRHFGTPTNPVDPTLVPGGSSSGSATAVASGLARLAVGTDTSGSTRVPAAFCGVVGYRASQHRHGPHSFIPLSPTLDCLGLFGRNVADVVALDGALTTRPRRHSLERPRLVVPEGSLLDHSTDGVRARFEDSILAIERAGLIVDREPIHVLEIAARLMHRNGTIVGHEALAQHEALLAADSNIEDATRRRLRSNVHLPGILNVYAAMTQLRTELQHALGGRLLACPTVPHEPPRLAHLLTDDDAYDRANASTLKTTMILSYLGTCGVSLPMRRPNEPTTTGILLSLPEGQDDRLLAFAGGVETALAA